jgi:hypothetical protein
MHVVQFKRQNHGYKWFRRQLIDNEDSKLLINEADKILFMLNAFIKFVAKYQQRNSTKKPPGD